MQGLVTIDFGNSNPHAGIFHKVDSSWKFRKAVPWVELHLALNQYGMDPHNTALVLAEVKRRESELLPLIEKGYLLTRVKDYWKGGRFAGMPVAYAHSLGEDRLIEAFYCYKKFKEPLLLINAGTYVTMDVVSEKGFCGGYIIPGMKSYFANYQNAELLKDVSLSIHFKHTLPTTTSEAMSESYTAFVALAKKLTHEHNISKIVLSGGDGEIWEGMLKNERIPQVVESNTHLIHWALQYWMTTQIEPL